jgi:tRNA-dihydrouridine synthase 1
MRLDSTWLPTHPCPAPPQGQSTPVSVKIRRFPDIADTVKYAQMLERAGASLIAVHGRTREQKDTTKYRADWDAIRAVKRAVSVPVLANGNIATLQDALE